MLPFTKRPGRGGDEDVITKDDLVQSPSSEGGKPASHVKRSMRPPAPSAGEDEMTTLIARSVTGPNMPNLPAPLPAAGRPATVPPPSPSRSRPVSMRPPPASMRPPPSSHRVDDDEDEDDDDGRTVVRGAPKIVKRSSAKSLGPQAAPASISPAAVIKATLESARRRDQLVPGPPSDLLEDSADFKDPPRTPFIGLTSQPPPAMRAMATVPFEGPPSHRPPAGYMPPPSSARGLGPVASAPMSAPVAYPGAQPSYVPNPSASVPGVAMPPSMPAHFMTPQYSDPPGTAVTSGHKISGRPAMSWAAALLGCGLLVGVAAVAVMQGSDAAADTTASFVDPSRAAKGTQPAAAQPPAPVATVAAATAPANPPATNTAPNPNAPPPGLIGASPVPPVAEAPATPPPVAATAAAVAAPTVAAPTVAAPTVAAPAATPHGVAFAPVAVPTSAPKPVAAPTPAPAPAPAPKPAVAWKPAPPPAAAPAPKPVAKPAPVEEDAPKKTAKKGGKGGSDADDETKKALEALQKAQLESASSFGQ